LPGFLNEAALTYYSDTYGCPVCSPHMFSPRFQSNDLLHPRYHTLRYLHVGSVYLLLLYYYFNSTHSDAAAYGNRQVEPSQKKLHCVPVFVPTKPNTVRTCIIMLSLPPSSTIVTVIHGVNRQRPESMLSGKQSG
jgi:hypothetical protein